MAAEMLNFPGRKKGKRKGGREKKGREEGKEGGRRKGRKVKGLEWDGLLGKEKKLCKK